MKITPQNWRRIGATAVVLGLLAALVVVFTGTDETDSDIVVAPEETQSQEIVHTVQPGEFIISIASQHQVPWQTIAVANETDLLSLNSERCGEKSEAYRNRRGNGHFCNERLTDPMTGAPMVHLNSLMPGDQLTIPLTSHPVVDEVVTNIPGQRIAIVIDDTGSMSDDRVEVGSWYIRASGQFQKDITTVALYADGHVREFTSTGEVNFTTAGGMENTRHALEVAAASQPDAIVLVSDEPGDDWGNWDLSGLPPVYAHSLEEGSHENLRRVATTTGGQLMRPPLATVLASN